MANNWGAMNGRISLFRAISPSPPLLPNALELYRRVAKSDPDNWQKAQHPLAPSVAQGIAGNIAINCTVQPLRVDFNLQPVPTGDTSLAMIGNTLKFYEHLRTITEEIGKGAAEVGASRIAIFVQFSRPTATIEETNQVLLETMPIAYRTKLTSEEDFIFQINCARPSREDPKIRMNLITKWSADRFQLFSVQIPMLGMPQIAPGASPATFQPTEELLAASVSFDHNNLPTAAPLDPVQQASLLRDGLDAAENSQKELGLIVDGG